MSSTGALTLLSTVGADTAYFPTLFFAFGLMGLGMGTAMLPLMTIAMSDVRPEDARPGQRHHQRLDAARRRAGDRGPRHARVDRSTELTRSGQSALEALTGGYTLAFEVAAEAVIVGIVIALVALRVPPREREPVPGSEVAVEV